MTRHRITHDPRGGGICRGCGHDLEARKDGFVYCSNEECFYADCAHPTPKGLNLPRKRTGR